MEGTKLILYLLFYGVIIFILIKLIIYGCKAQIQINKGRKQDKADGIKRFFCIEHVSGLNAVENTACSIVITPTDLKMTCSGKEYSLPLSRITYVDFKTDVKEIQKLKSSLAKGVAGAAMFGVSGAVIGSVPKTKTVNQVKGYAIIIYKNTHGNEQTIVLCDMSPNSYICSKLVRVLYSHIQTKVEKVEL